ncbi:4-oxalocrotonate tautomerase family protein [Marinobacter sp. 71-i]|uniref:Tautomerase n=1 Tax=Marinobacter iranensis TaxID=2962607 RepID=A0ABT5YB76_9GAMM|nr:4-oxalocrotonate tautomerase family protein [Marinobacter iranensis]MDF0750945.1 4-oxalocrotonate tautomerase family protein [Marinobacter iranensis]
MPYVNIKVTREGRPEGKGPSAEQKAELIAGATDLLVRVLDKKPSATMVVIDEVALEDWGMGGLPVPEYRARKARDA